MATIFDFNGSWRENKFVPRGQSMVKNKERGGGVKIVSPFPPPTSTLTPNQTIGWLDKQL